MSASLWESPSIDVIGFPWCKDELRHVSVASLTAKILCTTHNTALSDVDTGGSTAFRVLKRGAELRAEREQEARPRKIWLVDRLRINGVLLERWFLKTLINLGAGKATTPGGWAPDGAPFTAPPDRLVRIAFGLERFKKPAGLYAIAAVGETIESKDGMEAATLLDTQTNMLRGAQFTFRGFRFVLNTEEIEIPAVTPLTLGTVRTQGHALYHIRRINNRIGRTLSHVIEFDWR